MEIKNFQFNEEQKLPLFRDAYVQPDREKKTLAQTTITQVFKSTAHLAKLLPTGTVLAFQLISAVFTNQGQCDPVTRFMTGGLVIL
jgi:hypothetical protein